MKILRLLIQGNDAGFLSPEFRRPFRSIARDVGVDEGTVRNRIKRMHESGFIQEWRILVNPRIWSGGAVVVFFDVAGTVSKAALIDEFQLIPGVHVINRFVGTRMNVVFLYDDESRIRKIAELIRRLADAKGSTVVELAFPDCQSSLNEMDWRLLRFLDEDPRRPLHVVAAELGISSRTVRRKMRGLLQGAAAFAFPSLDPSALSGAVMALLEVRSAQGGSRNEIEKIIASRLRDILWTILYFAPVVRTGDHVVGFHLMLPNVSKGREILRWVREVPDVSSARIEFFEEVVTIPMAFASFLEKGARGSLPIAG